MNMILPNVFDNIFEEIQNTINSIKNENKTM